MHFSYCYLTKFNLDFFGFYIFFQARGGDPYVRPSNFPHSVPENSCGETHFDLGCIVSHCQIYKKTKRQRGKKTKRKNRQFFPVKDLDLDMDRLVGEAAREAPSLFYYTQYDLDKSVQM